MCIICFFNKLFFQKAASSDIVSTHHLLQKQGEHLHNFFLQNSFFLSKRHLRKDAIEKIGSFQSSRLGCGAKDMLRPSLSSAGRCAFRPGYCINNYTNQNLGVKAMRKNMKKSSKKWPR